MHIVEILKFVKHWNNIKLYPEESLWPEKIFLNSVINDNISKLFNYTNKYNKEYESSYFYIGNSLVHSPPFEGSDRVLNTRHSLKITIEFDTLNNIYLRNIYIDSFLLSQNTFESANFKFNNDIGYFFNIHTHPILDKSQNRYTFFSPTDINSLINSPSLLAGLVTDKVWLVCKTNKLVDHLESSDNDLLNEISIQQFANNNKTSYDYIINNFAKLGLVLYRGEFGKCLYKLK
jgi:hypothetical protein